MEEKISDFEKIENYYDKFDEWNRTFTPEGSLEFEITLEIMKKYTEVGDRVLDLGGGPGRYTYELAKSGRIMALGDISPKLISIAKEKTKDIENIESINVVNAIDLSIYGEDYFDTVLYMGPLYHLTDEKEIDISLNEVKRVLKSGGQIIAGFIPLLSGTAGIIERSMYAPGHVTSENLKDTYRIGTFRNNSEYGFQEGKYLSSEQVVELMSKTGFSKKSR